MIFFDTPRPVTFGGRGRMSAHLISDCHGTAGTLELVEFGKRIGLQARWLQKRGDPAEHFDIFDAAIDRARVALARQVTPRELGRLVGVKRARIQALGPEQGDLWVEQRK